MFSYMRICFLAAWIGYPSSNGSAAFAPSCPHRHHRRGKSLAHSDASDDDGSAATTLDRKTFLATAAATLVTSSVGPALAATVPGPLSAADDALAPLHKKSTTPSDVLAVLRRTHTFAPYATSGTAVVTGGNAGIGFETVRALARAGMSVILCSRRVSAGREAIGTLPEELRPRVTVQRLDLSDMRSVRDATDAITTRMRESRGGIDVLVNNAGVIDKKGDVQLSAQGLEMPFAVNHVGHHMLTRDLLPSMNRGGRVVTVSSNAHGFADAEQAIVGRNGYSGSKLCNILFAKSLQDRLETGGRGDVKSVSLHPGVIATSLFDNTTGLWPLIGLLAADRTAEQGAATTSLCALADNEVVRGGEFYRDCGVVTLTMEAAVDARGELRQRLWMFTEDAITSNGFALPATLA